MEMIEYISTLLKNGDLEAMKDLIQYGKRNRIQKLIKEELINNDCDLTEKGRKLWEIVKMMEDFGCIYQKMRKSND